MDFYFVEDMDGSGVLGAPAPAPGVRMVFDAEKLFAARERLLGRPVEHVLAGDEGLVVHEDPLGATWPCRLWRVDDVEGVVRLRPENRWFRCRALTVVEELPSWLVMGDRGAHVVGVIEQACRLTADRVRAWPRWTTLTSCACMRRRGAGGCRPVVGDRRSDKA